MNAPSKETHRYRRDAPAALAAAETETQGEIVAHLDRTATRLAREMRLMKGTAARTAMLAGLVSQVLIDLDQLLEKLDIGKDGVAHCGQSEVVRNRRLPQ